MIVSRGIEVSDVSDSLQLRISTHRRTPKYRVTPPHLFDEGWRRGTLIARAMYLIPSRDKEPFPLRKGALFAAPFALLVAIVLGRVLP